jgi:hypothetical protein
MSGAALAAMVALLGFGVWAGGVSGASAATYAPLDQPGPALAPTPEQLSSFLTCSPGVDNAKTDVVLLSPGTATTAGESFAWNWEPALNQLDIPWCAMNLPDQALGPIDVAAQYIVHAIRTVSARSGRKVDILGWSQGGMSMRWSLRFWPDTRKLVDDVIGFAASNHGTERSSVSTCEQMGCRPAVFQQAHDTEFIRALNSHTETFAGISYTNIYSRFDEVVIPNSDPEHCISCLSVGDGQIANIQTQQVCPLDVSDHVVIGVAPATYGAVVDALTHDGPAVLGRISVNCNSLLMPGVMDPAALAAIAELQAVVGTLAIAPGPLPNPVVGAPVVYSEPILPCYVYGTCADRAPQGVTGTCGGVPATIAGTDSADVIVGTSGADVIVAGGGDDVVNGGGGKDVICGGAGNDTLKGRAGNDQLLGQAGRDVLKGGRGNDACSGGTGTDRARTCDVSRRIP